MHLVAAFKGILFDDILLERLQEAEVQIYSVEQYTLHKGLHREKAVMGFANLTPERIREGVRSLKAVIRGY